MPMLELKIIISVLCALGLYASVFMFHKSGLAMAGKLAEPSVVQRPAARLFLGVPNAALGLAYYLGVAAVIWLAPALCIPAIIAGTLAACVSLYLAYSLLFLTRMPCPYCWTSHAVNWLLVPCIIYFCKFLQ